MEIDKHWAIFRSKGFGDRYDINRQGMIRRSIHDNYGKPKLLGHIIVPIRTSRGHSAYFKITLNGVIKKYSIKDLSNLKYVTDPILNKSFDEIYSSIKKYNDSLTGEDILKEKIYKIPVGRNKKPRTVKEKKNNILREFGFYDPWNFFSQGTNFFDNKDKNLPNADPYLGF